MTEYTPGPWEIMQTERDLFVCGPDGLPLTHTRPANTVRANAHLIASAPDLLETLENIENNDGHIPETIWAMRNAAIAKAKEVK